MTPFTLTAGEHNLRVLAFRGREAVSRPYRFAIKIAVEAVDAHELEAAVLGQHAVLSIATLGEPRTVAGIIASVEGLGALDQGQRAFRVQILPRLSLLSHRVTSRIFQEQTVPEIVAAVLGQAAVPMRSALAGKYAPRHYCVQYQESDLAFVTRLLAEEGIWYFFEHGAEERVVLADSVHLCQPIAGDPKLVYREGESGEGMLRIEHHVFRFEVRRALASGAVLERERDYRRPLLDLRGEAPARGNGGNGKGSGGPKSGPVVEVLPLETPLRVYEHHGEDDQPRLDDHSAWVRLEQLRRRTIVASGRSGCARLVPGLRFELVDHDIDSVSGSYDLAGVVHEGRDAGDSPVSYRNSFTCVPAALPLRPKLPAGRRMLQQVTEPAIVVGPEGQELHADRMGRVKVQFPWDLEGKKNEQSSCWVRVMQPWAGAGFGTQFIPRVGMEVMVGFEGGDTDRPIVLGCVYNGGAAPPFGLPATTSGIVTRTTPGGAGRNELSFDDAKGNEEVVLHAARDLTETAEQDMAIAVRRNMAVTVQGSAREQVMGQKRVAARCIFTDAGSIVERAGARRAQTAGDMNDTIGGGRSVHVGADDHVTVGGDSALQVAGSVDVMIGKAGQSCHYALMVKGVCELAGDDVQLRGAKRIRLMCGASMLELTPDTITISSKRLRLVADETVDVKRKDGPALCIEEDKARVTAKTVEIITEQASVVLDEDAKVNGKRVRLNCDPAKALVAKEAAGAVETQPFKMVLSDAEYGAYGAKHYRLTVDGETFEGVTDAAGLVDQKIPKDALAVAIEVWLADYPTGKTKVFTFKLAPLPGHDTPRGALTRLGHLGYFKGEPKDKLDDEARAALKDFQEHMGLPITGKLDKATVAQLRKLHGR
jgi:type VI secretion system secreted protein VgrG